MEGAPQFDQVWGLLCDEEGNTITRMVESQSSHSAFGFVLYFRRATKLV